MVNTLSNVAATLRLGLRMPKYPLWLGVGALALLARSSLDGPMAGVWWYLWPVSVASLLGVGHRKISRNRAEAAAGEAAGGEVVGGEGHGEGQPGGGAEAREHAARGKAASILADGGERTPTIDLTPSRKQL